MTRPRSGSCRTRRQGYFASSFHMQNASRVWNQNGDLNEIFVEVIAIRLAIIRFQFHSCPGSCDSTPAPAREGTDAAVARLCLLLGRNGHIYDHGSGDVVFAEQLVGLVE